MAHRQTDKALQLRAKPAIAWLGRGAKMLAAEMKDQNVDPFVSPTTPVTLTCAQVMELIQNMAHHRSELEQFAK